ncbi:glycosyltransferase family 4 protein [Clostridium sp.]|uniref:glycosyltransferase family 4 protein n=1 Tax=Clostridium sp. TaxID=1506 RepID=UPI0025C14B2A|nr:glycosyltransferase family 4 protein [Clostridium sp.]
MKVLLVSNMYPDSFNPQYGIFVKNSEEILVNNNIVVEKVVCTKKKGKFPKILQYISFYINVFFKVLMNKYDCIYVHYLSHSSLPLIIVKKMKRNIKIISNVHGSDVIPQNKKQEALNGLARACANLSEFVIVPSNYFKRELINRWKVDSERIFIFPSGGINNKRFKPKSNKYELKNKLGLSKNYKYIGFVGRLDKGKGWDILLKSIWSLKDKSYFNDYRFVFVGNGSEEEIFNSMIKNLGLDNSITHINFLNHSDLADLYNCLEIFCFPTQVNESLGLVGIEALACGIPVIASNFAGPTDYIIDFCNGYLAEKGNYKDFSAKLEMYILLPEHEKDKIKESALKSSQKYFRENIESSLIDLFNNFK